MWPMLLVPVAGVGWALREGLTHDDRGAVYVAIGVAVLLAAIMFGLVFPLRYVIDSDGLEIRAGRTRKRIPWEAVIAIEPSSNPLSSPALSLRRLAVRYTIAGEDKTILISPTDRAAFVRDCAAASKRHRADGERLLT